MKSDMNNSNKDTPELASARDSGSHDKPSASVRELVANTLGEFTAQILVGDEQVVEAILKLIEEREREARLDELLRLTRIQMIKTNTGTCEQRVVERLKALSKGRDS